MLKFWRRNAPHIGLTHPYVLHLISALAALHLANDEKSGGYDQTHHRIYPLWKDHGHYLSLAREHRDPGLSGLSTELARVGPDQAGALNLGATLTSYCTFALGPTSANDLLVCAADGEDSRSGGHHSLAWTECPPFMPLVHGMRLLRQSFSPEELFAGPMAPFGNGWRPASLSEEELSDEDDVLPLSWEEPLDALRGFIAGFTAGKPAGKSPETNTSLGAGYDPSAASVCLGALDDVIEIYAATYGRRWPDSRRKCDVAPEKKFVFGWLYRIDQDFVSCVKGREPLALLVLAHFALLLDLRVVREGRHIEGWREHIITAVAGMLVDDKYQQWLRWPKEQMFRAGTEVRV